VRQFTWRTISTWLYRYKVGGVTTLKNTTRSDKGQPRKVNLEELQDAVEKALPKLRGRTPTRGAIYRLCIEEGLLNRSQVAPNTFRRLVKQYEMLKPDSEASNKHRLAFSKAHAKGRARVTSSLFTVRLHLILEITPLLIARSTLLESLYRHRHRRIIHPASQPAYFTQCHSSKATGRPQSQRSARPSPLAQKDIRCCSCHQCHLIKDFRPCQPSRQLKSGDRQSEAINHKGFAERPAGWWW